MSHPVSVNGNAKAALRKIAAFYVGQLHDDDNPEHVVKVLVQHGYLRLVACKLDARYSHIKPGPKFKG